MSFTCTENCYDSLPLHSDFYKQTELSHTQTFMKYPFALLNLFFVLVAFWGCIDFIVPEIMLFIQTYSFTEDEDGAEDEGYGDGDGEDEGDDDGGDGPVSDHDDFDEGEFNGGDEGEDDFNGDEFNGGDEGEDDEFNGSGNDEVEKGMFETLPHTAYFTGDWRKPEFAHCFEKIKYWFDPACHDKLVILSQDDEACLQAKSAFKIFDMAYGAKYTLGSTIGCYFLAAGAGRGSAQFTVMNDEGRVVQVFKGPGIPKNETFAQNVERNKEYDEILEAIASIYEISYAVFFDSMFHLIKNTNAPVVPDGHEMPRNVIDIPTMMDFVEYYGFGKSITNAKTLVIRNVKIATEFGTQKRKISFITGEDYQFDIGSGNGALIDPFDGTKTASYEFGEWQNYENELFKIAHFLAFPSDYAVA